MSTDMFKSAKYLVLTSEFNTEITSRLTQGALDKFAALGVPAKAITTMTVPGAFELSTAASAAAASKKWDAIVCLGCLIQGETPHFTFISQAVAQGLTQVGLTYNIPVVFGILTTLNIEQALRRSGHTPGNPSNKIEYEGISKITVDNKGEDAAAVAVQMVNTLAHIKEVSVP